MENYKNFIANKMSSLLQPCQDPSDPFEWARLGWHLVSRLIVQIREERHKVNRMKVNFKEDGSPFTAFEQAIEDFCKSELKKFYSEAQFLGEENSGSFSPKEGEYFFVIDPIDGTRAFLSNFDTFSITISIIQDKKSIFSVVANPSTGDIVYRVGNNPSRLDSMSWDGDINQSLELPLSKPSMEDPILINVHPSVASQNVLKKLYTLWESKEIALVKSVSGSPSWQLIEVAKGSCIYINTWKQGVTMPFDLVAAFHILEGAGGMIVNFKGDQVDPYSVNEPFIAGFINDRILDLGLIIGE
jgi:fructose-1,6-bisphosphatase/inositol monophosphatase family enzyme